MTHTRSTSPMTTTAGSAAVSDDGSAPVLVGVDGSVESREALRWALQLGRMTGAPVEAVAAWEYPAVGYGSTAPSAPVYQPEADTKELLDTVVDEVAGPDAAAVRRTVAEGRASRVLIEASRRGRVLVVGSRGHGALVGLLLGSVSSACAEHAHCSVLVAHGPVQVLTDGPAPTG